MIPNEFYKSYPKDYVKKIVEPATTWGNFQQIALFNGSVSKTLAKKLEVSSNGEMSVLEILFPDDYVEQEAA